MHLFAHSHKESAETSPRETHGLILNWGWRYDLMTAFVIPFMFGRSERALQQMVIDLAQLQPGETVLDVGCGTGSLALLAKKRVGTTGRVYGIDPAPKQLARARAKAARRGLSINFQLGVIEQLAFPDQSFDVVLSTFMMHHLPDDLKRQGLSEIARVLRPGGRLLVLDAKGHAGPWKSDIQDQPALMKEAGFAQAELGDTPFRGLSFALGRKGPAGEGQATR